MDYKLQLQEINNKYYDKIKNAYGRYIKNFNEVPDMTKDVFIISDDECIDERAILKIVRGECELDTGYIYINRKKLNKYVLVHEYLHRLSRNFLDGNWAEGFMVYETERNLNELVNEVLTAKICGYELKNSNIYLIPIFYKIVNKIGYSNLLTAYFSSDINYLKQNLDVEYVNRIIKDCLSYKNLFVRFIKAFTYKI